MMRTSPSDEDTESLFAVRGSQKSSSGSSPLPSEIYGVS
jgi:hypothetical protein